MTECNIALIGTGALALELEELFGVEQFSAAFSEAGFVAEARTSLPVFTDPAKLSQLCTHYVLAIADQAVRIRLTELMEEHGLQPAPPLILPGAIISPSAKIGAGSVISGSVQIGGDCNLGKHNLLMHNVVIGHNSSTADHVLMSPGAFVAGYVEIASNVTIQGNASLARSLLVGEGALIALGAVCFRTVPAGALMIGNPARNTHASRHTTPAIVSSKQTDIAT